MQATHGYPGLFTNQKTAKILGQGSSMQIQKKSPATDENNGNPASWVDLYADYLYRFAIIRVADQDTAEELVQETFIAAIAAVKENRYQGKSQEKTWLTGILKHKIVDHLRRKYRGRALPLEQIGEDIIEASFAADGHWRARVGEWDINPSDRYEQKELGKILMACIEALQQRQADAVRLRELDEKTTEEICKILMITTTNYWVLMHRARLSLRQCVDDHWSTDVTRKEGGEKR